MSSDEPTSPPHSAHARDESGGAASRAAAAGAASGSAAAGSASPAAAAGADARAQDADESARPFGHYLLLRELGRGAQGVVFLAEDTILRRKVALKMLTSAGAQSQAARDRFQRERELTSKLEHAGICGVHEAGEIDGLPYIAMQFVRGTTLAQLIEDVRTATGGTATPDRGAGSTSISIAGHESKGSLQDVLHLVERAARALHTAHEAGLVHRDIKPANIMVTPEGDPVLLDFGLARDIAGDGQTLTQSGQILGTPAYLAPEQIVASRGTVDRRTDVYALGVTLFECLTLRRPFEGASWDQLFHGILEGAAPSPRKLNPRIPRDLATVIEVALERDQTRRYPTADAFAEDLRRVRSFEPIRAKSAGPITRLQKWTRRSPGLATGAIAVVVFVLIGAGLLAASIVRERRALDEQMTRAADGLRAGDFDAALLAIGKARELDPDLAAAVELEARIESARAAALEAERRSRDLELAERARAEAVQLETHHGETRRRIEALAAELAHDQPDVFARFASDGSRAAFARRQRELSSLRIDAERTLLECEAALQRAARLEAPWGGSSADTERALASFYLGRWREALAGGDSARAEVMRSAVVAHDPERAFEAELLGRGTLALAVVPADADVHLFRYEDYAVVRADDVIPRLVPVPTAGIGRVRDDAWGRALSPGDECLVVRAVDADSPAERAGLRPGDLITSIGGRPCRPALFATATTGAARDAGIRPLARILELDDTVVADRFDWVARTAEGKSSTRRVRFEGRDTPLECDPRELRVADASELIRSGAPGPLHVRCLRSGAVHEIDVPAGTVLGAECEPTAYPLIRVDANRLSNASETTLDPGSYLILAHAAGREDQRALFVVDRGARVEVRIELLAAGTTPPGFVHVPAGPYRSGGDPEAFRPRAGSVVDVPAFFLSRRELTNREWYEFVNDPQTLAKIAAAPPGAHLYLPQDDRVMARRSDDGTTYTWDVYKATNADSPVLGLSWNDANDYLEWRNRKAQTAGERWRYGLPTEREWEKAARGVDGRSFPWGDRFDPSLTVCMVRQAGFLLDAPGGFEPRDESPFGVLDMAGSREEWLSESVEGSEPPRYRKRGGWWGSNAEIAFRCASRGEASQDRFASGQGLRLVLREP